MVTICHAAEQVMHVHVMSLKSYNNSRSYPHLNRHEHESLERLKILLALKHLGHGAV